MKIALILSGEIRSFLEPPSMMDALRQDGYCIEVFAHLPDKDPGIQAFMEFWKQPPEGFKLRAVQVAAPQNISEAGIEESPLCTKHEWYKKSGVTSLQAVLRHIAASAAAGAMLRQAELQDGERYDWVIKTRYDLKFLRQIERLADLPAKIHFPAHDNCNGYNDKFSFGPSEAMEIHTQLFYAVPHLVDAGMLFHPESMLKAHLDLHGVEVARTTSISRVERYGIKNLVTWQREMKDCVEPRFMPRGAEKFLDLERAEAITWDGTTVRQQVAEWGLA